MTPDHFRRWLPVYQWAAGACDATTGLLLMVAPAWTLSLMGVQHGPQPLAFASFIGAFVFSVGAAYLYAARLPRDVAHAPDWQTVWMLTALTRTVVALFLAWQMILGHLELAWISVALTDGALALLQWTGLRKGWLHFK